MFLYSSTSTKKAFLQALWELNSFFENPSNTKNWFFENLDYTNGICCNVGDYVELNFTTPIIWATDVSKFFTQYWEKWPLYSGDKDFPIPGGERAYAKCLNRQLWINEQGEARIQLIQFLIQQISKDLNI